MRVSWWNWVWPKRAMKSNPASSQAYPRPESVTGWERRSPAQAAVSVTRPAARPTHSAAPTISEIIAADLARLEAIGRPAEKPVRPMTKRRAAEVSAKSDAEIVAAILRR